jgi:hypothetical protein
MAPESFAVLWLVSAYQTGNSPTRPLTQLWIDSSYDTENHTTRLEQISNPVVHEKYILNAIYEAQMVPMCSPHIREVLRR